MDAASPLLTGQIVVRICLFIVAAIAMAGGFTIYASKNKMQVVRNSANGDGRPHEIRIPARYDDLVSGKGELGNFILKAADIVVVP